MINGRPSTERYGIQMDGAVQKILGCFLSGNSIQGTVFLEETDKPQEHYFIKSFSLQQALLKLRLHTSMNSQTKHTVSVCVCFLHHIFLNSLSLAALKFLPANEQSTKKSCTNCGRRSCWGQTTHQIGHLG